MTDKSQVNAITFFGRGKMNPDIDPALLGGPLEVLQPSATILPPPAAPQILTPSTAANVQPEATPTDKGKKKADKLSVIYNAPLVSDSSDAEPDEEVVGKGKKKAGKRRRADKVTSVSDSSEPESGKKKNFSWSKHLESVLVEALAKGQGKMGRAESGFKPKVYESVLRRLLLLPGTSNLDVGKIKSKWRIMAASYGIVKELRGISGAGWNDEAQVVTLPEQAAAEIKASDPKKAAWIGKPFPLYEAISQLLGHSKAQGKVSKDPLAKIAAEEDSESPEEDNEDDSEEEEEDNSLPTTRAGPPAKPNPKQAKKRSKTSSEDLTSESPMFKRGKSVGSSKIDGMISIFTTMAERMEERHTKRSEVVEAGPSSITTPMNDEEVRELDSALNGVLDEAESLLMFEFICEKPQVGRTVLSLVRASKKDRAAALLRASMSRWSGM